MVHLSGQGVVASFYFYKNLGDCLVRSQRLHPDLAKMRPGGNHTLQSTHVLASEQLRGLKQVAVSCDRASRKEGQDGRLHIMPLKQSMTPTRKDSETTYIPTHP